MPTADTLLSQIRAAVTKELISELRDVLDRMEGKTVSKTKTKSKIKSYTVGQNGPLPSWIITQEGLKKGRLAFHKLIGKYGRGHVIRRKT
jgi:hypothetical protein